MKIKPIINYPPNLDSTDYKRIIGKKMRILRKRAGMTQSDVKEYLEYDSSGMMSQVETGKSGMSMEQIYKAANLFGVHPFILLSDDDLDDEKLEMYLNLSQVLKRKKKSKYFEALKQMLEIAIAEK